MAGEGLTQPIEPTNEDLFWAAYSVISTDELSDVGDMLDQRIDGMLDDFHTRTFDATKPAVSAQEARELIALQYARGHVNSAYGTKTGFKRTGCSLGLPVRYEHAGF